MTKEILMPVETTSRSKGTMLPGLKRAKERKGYSLHDLGK